MSVLIGSVQHKRDTAANFTVNNPILLSGQIGIELDDLLTSPKLKIGDGITAWNVLPYFTGGAIWGGITGTLSNQIDLNNVLNARELLSNKATDFSTLNNTLYPTTLAVANYITASIGAYLPLAGGTMSGNILFASALGIDTTSTGGTDALYIGGTNADLIYIGRAAGTTQVSGQLWVVDPLITLNKNQASAAGAGLEFEESAIIAGYAKIGAARNTFLFKMPAVAYYGEFDFNTLSADRSWKVPNVNGTLMLIDGGQTVTSATWKASVIEATYGGTGINNATRTITINSNPAIFTFSGAYTLTIPATGTVALGTGAANRFTYWSGTNTIAAAAAIAAGLLVFTDTNGLPTGHSNLAYSSSSRRITMTSGATSDAIGFSLTESAANIAGFFRLGSTYGGGNFSGTSISSVNSLYFFSGQNSTQNLVFAGSPIYALGGITATNAGFRVDTTGMLIDSINNLHNSAGARLHLVGSGSGSSLLVYKTDRTTNTLTLQEDGRFGVGNVTPSATQKMVIQSSGYTESLTVVNGSSTKVFIAFETGAIHAQGAFTNGYAGDNILGIQDGRSLYFTASNSDVSTASNLMAKFTRSGGNLGCKMELYDGAGNITTKITGNATDNSFVTNKGVNMPLSGNIYTATASTTITGTTTETTLIPSGVGTATLTANYLDVGKKITVKAFGYFTTPASATTLTFRFKLGGTTLATSIVAAPSSSATNTLFYLDFTVTCRTTGSSGTVVAGGAIHLASPTGSIPRLNYLVNTGTTTINTTTTNAIDATLQLTSGAGSDSYTIQQLAIMAEN